MDTECYPDKAPKIDELLEILSHHLRREIIHYFENHTTETTATLGELSDHIGSRIPSQTPTELTRVFDQIHLPRLDDTDWVRYDTENHRVTYHGHSEAESLLAEVHCMFA